MTISQWPNWLTNRFNILPITNSVLEIIILIITLNMSYDIGEQLKMLRALSKFKTEPIGDTSKEPPISVSSHKNIKPDSEEKILRILTEVAVNVRQVNDGITEMKYKLESLDSKVTRLEKMFPHLISSSSTYHPPPVLYQERE